jgi:hypothetical protein
MKATGSGTNTGVRITLFQGSSSVKELASYLGYASGGGANSRHASISGSYLSSTVSSSSTAVTFTVKAVMIIGGGTVDYNNEQSNSTITLMEISA